MRVPTAGSAIIPGAGSLSLCPRWGPVALQIFQSMRDHGGHFPGRGDAMQRIDLSLGRGEEPSGKGHAMQTADPSPGSGEECALVPEQPRWQRRRFSECGVETSSLSITWGLAGNTEISPEGS